MTQINIQNPPQIRRMHLPIGCSNFSDVVCRKLDFIDKTLFIKEILDNFETTATVITRPRRFGKTLNLSMLHYFLAGEVGGQPTKALFDGLKITKCGDQYMQHQGKYPVISITFKSVTGNDYEALYKNLYNVIADLYREHRYLLSSSNLADDEKEVFLSILNENADSTKIANSLHSLSRYIYQHTGVKPWLLIDEYDTPIQTGYVSGFYPKIIEIMKVLFGTSLKDNQFLQRAIVTGILRVSKESLFSHVNNIRVCSLIDEEYSEHFGFTEEEVEALLKKAGLSSHYPSIRHWYNGYQIGESTIYNPWSVINCVQRKGALKPYWINTSGNDLIKHLLARGSRQLKMDLETIIQGETITALIDENLAFGDLEKNKSAIWSLLFFCGYFKAIHIEYKDTNIQCELAVPNYEVMALYRGVIRGWLAEPLGEQYLEFLLNLTEGKIEDFTAQLQDYLEHTFSVFDASGKEPEKFYHGFVLGMMVCLSDTHEVKSNRESGYGRYDVMLIPKDPEQLGIILEFKTVRDEKINLETAAKEALQQINQRNYALELQQRNINNILKIGLAFHGKQVAVLSE